MSVFSSRDFDGHEQIAFACDEESGLKAIVAIHNTNRGPGLGGCRMWPYTTEDEAISDALRLSRGMTYKSAVSNLPLGGGKSVIIGNSRTAKTPELLKAMGRAVDRLGGRYIIAEDVGTSVEDVKLMGGETRHVAGIVDKLTRSGERRSGDPSPATAYGTFVGLKAAVKYRLDRDELDGLKVAVQGAGHVGLRLAKLLHEAGAHIWITDIYDDLVKVAVDELGATPVAADDIYAVDCDVFAPCALGAILNDRTIPQLQAKIIAGASNNQLSEDRHGKELMRRGILYAPDYVINAGGIIDVYYEYAGDYERDAAVKHIEGIYDTLIEIFERSKEDALPTNLVADHVARERFTNA